MKKSFPVFLRTCAANASCRAPAHSPSPSPRSYLVPWRLRTATHHTSISSAGTISDEFGYLLTLVTLDLSSNMLTGGIHAVSKLHSIQTIRLQKNAFQSVDLSDFGRLSLLQELNLENNGLPGVLPSEWPNGGRMRSLNVAKNALSGSIPPHMLDHMPLLESFMANENELEGTIPWAEWAECNLTSVHTLELQSNALTGEISEEIGAALPSLTVLRLHANELSGTMPAALADLANLLELRADGNSLGPIVESTALLCSLWFPPRGVEYCDLSGQLGNALSCGALPPPECLAAHCSVAACAPRPPGPTLPNASNTPGGGAGGDGLFASLASEALFVMLMSCGTVGIGVAALLAVLCVVVVVLGPTKIGQCVRGCRFGQPRTRGGGKGGGGGGGTEMSGLERDTSGADAPHAGHLAARLLRYIHEEMLTSPTGLRGGRRRARRGRTELASPDIFSSDDDPRPFSEGEVEDDDESSQLLTDSSVSTAALGMMDCAYAVSEESTSTDE